MKKELGNSLILLFFRGKLYEKSNQELFQIDTKGDDKGTFMKC
jgi:hypothetical protein